MTVRVPGPPALTAERAALATDLVELQTLEIELDRRILPLSLKQFCFKAWPLVEPDRAIAWNWHLDEICRVLTNLRDGSVTQQLVAVPPGTMKSLLCSVFYRAWLWASDPTLRFLAGSYGGHLSIRDNVKLRTIVTSSWFNERWPDFTLVGDGKERLDTAKGGWSIATSVGGVGTGEHPDYVLIDDPLTEQQSRSDTERASASTWIDRTLSTRGIARKVRFLLSMQRLHVADPFAHLASKGWSQLVFPMEYEVRREATDTTPAYEPDPRDPRSEAGELLWPSLIPQSKVAEVKIALGPFGTASQLQQQPGVEGAGLFKRAWFEVIDAPPGKLSRKVRGWDDAGTENGGCFTVGVRIAEYDVGPRDSVFVIEDIVRGQWGPNTVEETILATATLDGRRDCPQREEKEGGSAGLAVIASRVRLLQGYDYQGVAVTGDKVTRAKPFRTQCEARKVKLMRAPWNEAYLAELEAFPEGTYKDQVDASSTAYNTLILEPKKRRSLTW